MPVRGDAIEAVLVERSTDVTTVTELYRITLLAGRTQHSEPHAAGVTEHWIACSGSLRLGPSGATVRIAAGGTATFPGDVPHVYEVDPGVDVAATLLLRYPR